MISPPPQKKKKWENITICDTHHFFVCFFKIPIPKKTFDVGTFEAVQEVQMESQSWYAKASAVVEVRGGKWGIRKGPGWFFNSSKVKGFLYDG